MKQIVCNKKQAKWNDYRAVSNFFDFFINHILLLYSLKFSHFMISFLIIDQLDDQYVFFTFRVVIKIAD